jgi:hypothetical protein
MTATTITIHTTASAAKVDAQVARMVRRPGRPPAHPPKQPWEHARLFREPVYTDGQPYARDEDHDTGD